MARDLLSVTKLGRGFTCGELLQTSGVRHFPKHLVAKNLSIFEIYMQLFEEMAKEIVP